MQVTFHGAPEGFFYCRTLGTIPGEFRASQGIMAGAGEEIHVMKCPYDTICGAQALKSRNRESTVHPVQMNNVGRADSCDINSCQVVSYRAHWRVERVLFENIFVQACGKSVQWR